MSAITANFKQLDFELVVNDDRLNSEIIEQIASTLHVAAYEQPGLEYVQLRHVKHIKEPQKEARNAATRI